MAKPPRSRCTALAGVAVAFALIGSGIATLKAPVLGFDAWPSVDPAQVERQLLATPEMPEPARAIVIDAPRAAERRAAAREAGSDAVREQRSVVELTTGSGSVPRPSARPVARSADSDDDGLPDLWEAANGLDPSDPADAARDDDGDGLTNATEFRAAANPQKADSNDDGRADGEDDPDGDGLTNAVEQKLSIDPAASQTAGREVADALADADGDGVTNVVEVAAGTDPATPDAPPAEVAPEQPADPATEPETVPLPEVVTEPLPDDPPAPGDESLVADPVTAEAVAELATAPPAGDPAPVVEQPAPEVAELADPVTGTEPVVPAR